MKELEIEKTKSTFTISVLKVENLVSSIFNFFINRMALANKWMRKLIPSLSNSALEKAPLPKRVLQLTPLSLTDLISNFKSESNALLKEFSSNRARGSKV